MIQIKRYVYRHPQPGWVTTTLLTLEDIPVGAIVHRELMGDHYVKLPFSTQEPIYFKPGDFCFIGDYGFFELTEPYSPRFNTDTGGYDYELKLDAYYYKWKNKICKYVPTSSASETSFKLTATISTHLEVIVKTINAIGAKEPSFKYDGVAIAYKFVNFDANLMNTAKFKQYNDTNIIAALDDLAKLYDCEWWVDDNFICFGRLELDGEAVAFSTDAPLINVSEISYTESKKEYANRIYVFGSDRNIPKDYRKDVSADVTKNGVVQKRLMLPLTGDHACPYGYVQDGNLSEARVVEAVMIDDSVYPREQCVVSRVETYTKTYVDEETNEEVTQTFYRIYDGSGFRFSTDYILPGETLHILFQSGRMNGMDFECYYDDEKRYYEVVVNENYGRLLPDADLHPNTAAENQTLYSDPEAEGDKFVIYGWDSSKIANTGIIEDAEEELYQAALRKLEKLKIDPNVYTCKMMSDIYESTMNDTDVHYVHYDLGQKVNLYSPAHFEDGRDSRIIGYEIKLDFPYDEPQYMVGEATAYSRTGDMQNQIDAITMNGSSYVVGGNGGVGGVFLITSTSKVPASDTNAYSAKRTDLEFLHKRQPDTAQEEIGFLKGLWVKVKGLFGFSEDGDITARSLTALGSSGRGVTDIDNATRKNLGLEVVESGIIGGILRVAKNILTKTIQSLNFTGGDSMFGTGWQLTDDDGNGNSRLVVDNLFVRMKAVFNELEVRKFVAMGGNYVFSPAASIIEEVDYIGHDENNNEVVLGYEYVKVPWVLRLVPLSLVGKILSKKKMVRSTMSAQDWAKVDVFRCWIKSDDGTTRTINTWSVGMLARCQTFDVSQGSGTQSGSWLGQNVTNKLYWRAVVAIGKALTKQNYTLPNHILEDGLQHNYIDLANYTDDDDVQLYLTGSDKPEALDDIVCYGNWKDNTLSNLIVLETVGDDAPAIKEFLGVGYTDGTDIDWTLTNKMRTKISPKTGNRFVAPSFVVTTGNGTSGDTLYNERNVGVAYRYDSTSGVTTTMATNNAIVLLLYSNIETDNAYKVCKVDPPSVQHPAYTIRWEFHKANLGDAYVNQQDGHRYVATPTGWEDRGLSNESNSSLKVDLNGITTRVSDAEGNISQLQQTAAGLASIVSHNSLSRNILSGVLTGIGWKSGVWDNGTFTPSGNISVDEDGWFTKNAQADNCFALEGVSLDAGDYMLSVCSAVVSDTGTPAVDYPSLTCYLKKASNTFTITTSSGVERRESNSSIEVTSAQSGDYTLYIVSPKIRFPQLEMGTSVTDFDAPVLEESLSLILQTADNISLSIINKLGETGINISGNNRSIELRGDKVTFTNTAGTVSGKVYIDPTTGALVASDAIVNGIVATNAIIAGITATNASVSGSLVSENGEMMHKVVIDALTGGIITYGPDHSDHYNNDLPAQGAEYGKTVEIGWGTDPDANYRYGIISVHNAADNSPSHGTIIDNESITIEDQYNAARMTSDGIGWSDSQGRSAGMEMPKLLFRCLRVAKPNVNWYDAKLTDDMITTDYNGAITINLPDPYTSDGKFYFIKHKKDKNTNIRCTAAENRGDSVIMNDDSEGVDWQRNIQNNSTLVFCDGEHWILMELDY